LIHDPHYHLSDIALYYVQKYCQRWLHLGFIIFHSWHNLLRSLYFNQLQVPDKFFWNWKIKYVKYSFQIFITSLGSSFFLAPYLIWGIYPWNRFAYHASSMVKAILNMPTGTFIFIGALAAVDWIHKLCKWFIFWTSGSYWFLRGSRRHNNNLFQILHLNF